MDREKSANRLRAASYGSREDSEGKDFCEFLDAVADELGRKVSVNMVATEMSGAIITSEATKIMARRAIIACGLTPDE